MTKTEDILQAAIDQEVITLRPDSKDVQEKLASHLLAQAIKGRRSGEKGPHVDAILDAAEYGESVPEDKDEYEYQQAIQEYLPDGIPIPEAIKGDTPNLPLDLTELTDQELRYAHGAFNAVSARIGWLYAQEEAGEAAAKQIADHYEEEYIVTTDRKDFGGKPKPQALLKAEAKKDNPAIDKWRKRERKHAIKSNKYKRLLDVYSDNCDRLSREYTMRQSEREHSGH